MAAFNFNFKFLKENATAGAWRRGYELYTKDMVIDSYPEKTFIWERLKEIFKLHTTQI